MKAFITGINGQDGSYLAEYLIKQNYEVHGTIRRSSSINTSKIEELINKLYIINKEVVSLEGKLLRLAMQHKITREEFLDKYVGNENNPYWLRKITRLSGWEKFVKSEKNNIKNISYYANFVDHNFITTDPSIFKKQNKNVKNLHFFF